MVLEAPKQDPNCFLFCLLAPRSRSCSLQTWMLHVMALFACDHKTWIVSQNHWIQPVRNKSNPARPPETTLSPPIVGFTDKEADDVSATGPGVVPPRMKQLQPLND